MCAWAENIADRDHHPRQRDEDARPQQKHPGLHEEEEEAAEWPLNKSDLHVVYLDRSGRRRDEDDDSSALFNR